MKLNLNLFRSLKRAILVMAPFVFLASCEKPTDSLGFNQVIGGTMEADTIHIPVQTYTTEIDSILVAFRYPEQLVLGGYASIRLMGENSGPLYGSNRAELLAQVLPRQLNPDFGSNPVIDSVKLNLRLVKAFGDTSVPMDIEVWELAEGFSRDSLYFSNYNPAEKQLLGSLRNYIPRPNTNRRYNQIRAIPYTTVYLDNNYFQSNFADVSDGNYEPFSSFSKFLDQFKGLKIKASQGNSILAFSLLSSFTELQIHYHNDSDTTSFVLDFSQDRSTVPIHFSRFEQDYAQAAFNLDQQDTVKGELVSYSQSMGGVATALKIAPQRIDSLTKEGLVINKAYLELSTAPGTGDPAPPSPNMEIRGLDGKGLGSRSLDFQGNSGDGNLRLGALRNNRYVFDLSRHLFNVLNSGENNTLAIVPVDRTTAAYRTAFQGGKKADQAPKLIVYYTKP